MVSLEIYVDTRCLTCRRSLALADDIRQSFPQMSVEVIEIASNRGQHRHLVTATPTFVLDGVTFSLGNPGGADLVRAIQHLLARQKSHEPQI